MAKYKLSEETPDVVRVWRNDRLDGSFNGTVGGRSAMERAQAYVAQQEEDDQMRQNVEFRGHPYKSH